MKKKHKFCAVCSLPTEYNAVFDIFFCRPCNRWNEEIGDCEDPECEFCSERRKGVPDKPLKNA